MLVKRAGVVFVSRDRTKFRNTFRKAQILIVRAVMHRLLRRADEEARREPMHNCGEPIRSVEDLRKPVHPPPDPEAGRRPPISTNRMVHPPAFRWFCPVRLLRPQGRN